MSMCYKQCIVKQHTVFNEVDIRAGQQLFYRLDTKREISKASKNILPLPCRKYSECSGGSLVWVC
jgi:hypothetical protein